MSSVTERSRTLITEKVKRSRLSAWPFQRGRSSIRRSQRRLLVGVLVPTLIFYFSMRYYPILRTLYLSMTDARLLSPTYNFVGLQNFYTQLSSTDFWKIMWNTTYYAFGSTVAIVILALILAFLMDPIGRGSGLLRLVYFLPTITSTIATATIWLWLYQPRFGLFNQILGTLGIPPIPWLTSVEWAMPSLIIMAIWGGAGFSALIFLAGLKGIPVEVTEAAVIDGATSLQVIHYIRLPLLSRVISFVLVTDFMGGFQVFQQVFLMTGGGPLDATRVLALEIYHVAFQRLRIAEAATLSFLLFVVVGVLTILYMRLQESDWEY